MAAPAETAAVAVGEMRLTGEAKVLWDALMVAKLFREDTFDAPTREKLSSLEERHALDALGRYRDANTSQIRNTSRYMMKIISRVMEAHERTGEHLKDVVLDPTVVKAIDNLIRDKKIEDAEFREKAISALKTLPVQRSLEILDKYLKVEHMHITNPVGFLMGLIKRYHMYENDSDTGAFGKIFATLPPTIQALFSAKFAEGAVDATQLSHKCLERLAALPLQEQTDATNALLGTDLTTVRNLTGFFIGILKRYQPANTYMGGMGGGYRGGRGGGFAGGERYGAGGRDRDRDYGNQYGGRAGGRYDGGGGHYAAQGGRRPYGGAYGAPPPQYQAAVAAPSYQAAAAATAAAAPGPGYPVHGAPAAVAPPATYPATYAPAPAYGR